MAHHIARRALGAVAGAAALSLGLATAASAHHCYKVDWNEKAYANHAQGGTAWVPLSQVGAMIISQDIGMPECAGYADVAIQHWMAETGTSVEPILQSKATVGSGAYYKKGKAPKSFAYLGESDFMILEEGIGMAIDACMADLPV